MAKKQKKSGMPGKQAKKVAKDRAKFQAKAVGLYESGPDEELQISRSRLAMHAAAAKIVLLTRW